MCLIDRPAKIITNVHTKVTTKQPVSNITACPWEGNIDEFEMGIDEDRTNSGSGTFRAEAAIATASAVSWANAGAKIGANARAQAGARTEAKVGVRIAFKTEVVAIGVSRALLRARLLCTPKAKTPPPLQPWE